MATIRRVADWIDRTKTQELGYELIICLRCGAECAVPPQRATTEIVCPGCVQPLRASVEPPENVTRALRQVADWWDKSGVPGPGYGVVRCTYCDLECVVPVSADTSEIGCIGCLRLLGPAPLLRVDLASWSAHDPVLPTEVMQLGG